MDQEVERLNKKTQLYLVECDLASDRSSNVFLGSNGKVKSESGPGKDRMKKFPAEFSDILSDHGLRILRGDAKNVCSTFSDLNRRFIFLPNIIDKKVATECTRILDDRLYPHLKTELKKIPADSITRMTQDFSEALAKTMHAKTAFFERRTARAYQAAEDTQLLKMLRSQSFIDFGESITGCRLAEKIDCQVLCYEQGDYVGPHTDHYPEDESRRDGYIDIHIMFSNSAVSHQWLVYEAKGYFSKILSINVQGGIAVYKLPFWHYTTPLVSKPGREDQARRWVLLGTFGLANKRDL
jgi:hypothetical protein